MRSWKSSRGGQKSIPGGIRGGGETKEKGTMLPGEARGRRVGSTGGARRGARGELGGETGAEGGGETGGSRGG